MAYLGSPPQSGFITTAKQRVTSSTNAYVDLDHAISSLADVIVWVNYVKQDATNLTLTTSTRITLGATLVSSDVVEIAYLGKAVNTQTPSTGTVTNDMLAGSIANSKLATPGATLTGSTDNTVVTVTGANAMQGEANLTFDGTDLDVGASAKISSNGAIANFSNHNGSATETALATSDGNEKVRCFNDGKITFEANGSEKMRIASDGNVFVGKTSGGQNDVGIKMEGANGAILCTRDGAVSGIFTRKNTDGEVIRIMSNTSTVGTISISGSSTAYNTSSDYRLKENETSISDGITRLKTLKPYRFNFKEYPDTTVDGFFAHEVSNVVPEAISGEKDGKEMQGIDQSKLVPLLTSALQEAITKIETLEARVQALENA